MKKRMISMAMTAVMALTLVVAAAPAEVHASSPQTANSTVSYTHTNAVGQDDFIIQIPSGINITAADTAADATVKMLNSGDNEAYTGQKKVTVTVASTNDYKLTSGGSVELKYTLKYNSNTMSSTSANVGTLQSSNNSVHGEASLAASEITKAYAGATYTDTLTYTVTPQS